MISAGPVRNTSEPSLSQRTCCAPPGATTFTGDVTLPAAMAATADAQDPVPDDWVSPEVHIGSLCENPLRLNRCADLAPFSRELVHETYELRISHRDPQSLDRSPSKLQFKFSFQLGDTHVHFKFKMTFCSGNESASLYSRARPNPHLRNVLLIGPVGGYAAGSIARYFRVAAIGID
jgi:hypothetical protein